MEITPSLLSGQVTLTATPKELRNWQVGQVLKAVVSATPTVDTAVLRVGTQTLTARMSFPVQPGQVLELQVQTLGQQPQLQAVIPSLPENPVQAALRAALPRQDGLAPLLANVALLARTPVPPLPDLVTQALRTLFKRAPEPRQLATADGLRQAVQRSGTFLEPSLAREAQGGAPAQPQHDLKAALLNLRHALREAVARPAASPPAETPSAAGDKPPSPPPASAAPQTAAVTTRAIATALETQTPPPLPDSHPQAQARAAANLQLLDADPSANLQRLLHQTEGALARLQLSQLSSQHVDHDGTPPMWLLEIPLRQGDRMDILQLRVERDAAQADGDAASPHRWSVELALALDGLGPLYARVGVQGEQVSTVWWAERPEAARMVRGNLDELETRLNRAGLTPTQLLCHEGAPPSNRKRTPNAPLLDEKA